MSFKSRLTAFLSAAALLLSLAAVAFAAPEAAKSEAAKPETAKPEAALRAAYPQVKFDSITPSEIPGLYEVVAGQNIFYYYPEKDLIIAGEIFGKDLKSRTAERRGQLAAKVVKTLPLEKAVRVGDGKKVVVEFTDPDCPYCREASKYFTKRSDVTRYVFFAPIAHPNAITKVEYILGAENPAQAYDAMMMGEEIPKDAKPATPAIKALAQEHLELARKAGIQGTPTFFFDGQQVVGNDTAKFNEMLK